MNRRASRAPSRTRPRRPRSAPAASARHRRAATTGDLGGRARTSGVPSLAVRTGQLTAPEIAETLGVPLNTVYSRQCQGADCDALSPTMDACQNAHDVCTTDPKCSEARNAVQDFIAQHKDCTKDEDCQVTGGGCTISETSCAGEVYVNNAASGAEFDGLRQTLPIRHSARSTSHRVRERITMRPVGVAIVVS